MWGEIYQNNGSNLIEYLTLQPLKPMFQDNSELGIAVCGIELMNFLKTQTSSPFSSPVCWK